MGCSICLESFLNSQDESGRRPASLSCGHVFHFDCVTQWLDARRTNHGSGGACPLCKVAATHNSVLRLYPSDIHDLDNVLAQRNDPQRNRVGCLPSMTSEATDALLNDLIDFHWATQQYVLGVLGINLVTVQAARAKIFKLIQDKTMNSAVHTQVDRMMQSVSNALQRLEDQSSLLERKGSELFAQRESVRKEQSRLKSKAMSLKVLEGAVQKREAALQDKADEVVKCRADLLAEMASYEERVQKVRQEEEKTKEEARRAQTEAMRARIEAKQLIASKEDEVQARLAEMSHRLQEAQIRQQEAEMERDMHKQKELAMADQMRSLTSRLKECKAAILAEKKKRHEERARNDNLRVQTALHSSSRPSNGHVDSTTMVLGNVTSGHTNEVELTTRLQDSQQSGPRELFEDRSNILALESKAGKRRKIRGNDGFDPLDFDFDDEDELPMPGLPARSKFRKSFSAGSPWSTEGSAEANGSALYDDAGAVEATHPGGRTSSEGWGRSQMPLRTSSTSGAAQGRRDDGRDYGDAQMRKWMAPLIDRNTKGIVIGPKLKNRDAY